MSRERGGWEDPSRDGTALPQRQLLARLHLERDLPDSTRSKTAFSLMKKFAGLMDSHGGPRVPERLQEATLGVAPSLESGPPNTGL